jgi:hypothetical protein
MPLERDRLASVVIGAVKTGERSLRSHVGMTSSGEDLG